MSRGPGERVQSVGAELVPFLLANFGMFIAKQRKNTFLAKEKGITFFGMFVSSQEIFIKNFYHEN